jgi:cysteine desulfurase/selenocysteine lyase
MDIERIRRDFPALQQYTWFQNGGVSITPAPVAAEHIRCMEEILRRGPLHIVYPDEEYPRRQTTMAKLASFFGVKAAELALMRGVSEGFQTVIRGIEWQEGDEILISEDEEAALLLPALQLRDLHGVKVVKVPLLDDVDQQVAAVEERLGARTKLLALSHVTTDLGFRLPVEKICRAANERGVLSFLDMAHSAGLYAMNLRELGCDFAGLLSYKWMYSPYAAGLLYVRGEKLEALRVHYAGGRAEARLDFVQDTYELHETAERFQYGPWSWPLVHSWAFAVEYLRAIGQQAIWARTTALADQLKEGILHIAGAELYTPKSAECSAALVSFGLEGWRGEELSQVLREEHNMIIKAMPHGREGLRGSMAFFLHTSEIDQLITALAELAEQRRAS